MLEVKVYVTGTSAHDYFITTIEDQLRRAGIPYNLKIEKDVNIFLEKKIKSIPAIQINNAEIYELNKGEYFHRSVRHTVQQILRNCKYGEMKSLLFITDFSQISYTLFKYASSIAKRTNAYITATILLQGKINENNHDQESENILKLYNFVKSQNQDPLGEAIKNPFIEKDILSTSPDKWIIDYLNKYDLVLFDAKNIISEFLFESQNRLKAYLREIQTPILIIFPNHQQKVGHHLTSNKKTLLPYKQSIELTNNFNTNNLLVELKKKQNIEEIVLSIAKGEDQSLKIFRNNNCNGCKSYFDQILSHKVKQGNQSFLLLSP